MDKVDKVEGASSVVGPLKDSSEYSLHYAGDTDCLKLVLQVSTALTRGCNPDKRAVLLGVVRAMIVASEKEDRQQQCGKKT